MFGASVARTHKERPAGLHAPLLLLPALTGSAAGDAAGTTHSRAAEPLRLLLLALWVRSHGRMKIIKYLQLLYYGINMELEFTNECTVQNSHMLAKG